MELYSNQAQDGRTLSRGMHYRSYENKAAGDKLGIAKNRVAFSGRPGPKRVCSTICGWILSLNLKI